MHTNRLAHESSPYLLQHAHNPVDWYPWGPEAFAAAKERDKPIFLSVGYSTCYWCHVMERQSFENEAIAAEMNRRFINVKVDREERPDVDQLYMNAVQAMTGQGGWPMSVFLTPELMPFYGGTYFPPTDGHGRIGFPRLLAAIEEAWKNRRDQVLQSAGQLVEAVRKMGRPSPPRDPVRIDRSFIENMLDRSTADYDPVAGGFGSAPKFPREALLELILVSQQDFPNQTRLRQVLHTLDAMAAGGIRDHLGGAFHRYSTDDQWLVPHFEIMLYDNAMLLWIYAQAFSQTRNARYAMVAGGIADFILREMTSPEGAFYTAIDAEVDAREGEPYLWTADEIVEVLGSDAELFNRVYGVDQGPNFRDPHQSGSAEKNILYLPRPMDEAMDQKISPMREVLYARRRQRKQPLLDTKILTSWNALMIRGLVHAGKILEESRYLEAAQKAAEFLVSAHRTADGLHRVSRDGNAKGSAFLDDYAFLAQALLDLGRREDAEQLSERMRKEFLDEESGGFFFTQAGAPDIIVRQKIASDSPLPSGNAVAAGVMLQLGHAGIARGTLVAFAGQLDRFGEGMSAMVQTALRYVMVAGELSISGGGEKQEEIVSLEADWPAPDRLEISLAIAPGFHLNANPAGEGLIATQLAVSGKLAEAVAGIEYPPAVMQKFEFADRAIPIYDGQVIVTVRFNRPVTAGEELILSLHYQPCDENSCRAPVRKTFTISME